MNRNKTVRNRIIIGASLLLDLVIIVIILLFRNNLLHWAFTFEQRHLEDMYHLNVQVADIRFASWNCIQLSGVCVQPDSADTLAVVQKLQCKPSLFNLLGGRLVLNELSADSIVITALNEEERSNVSFLRGNKKETSGEAKKQNYYQRIGDWKDRLLKFFNTPLSITHLQINYRDTASVQHICVPEMIFNGHQLSVRVINQAFGDTLIFSGEVVKKDEIFKVSIRHTGSFNYFPFLDAEHGLKCGFDSVNVEIKLEEVDGEITVWPTIDFHNFHLQHWRLAKGDVVFPQAQFSGVLRFKRDGVEIDSSSSITLNHATSKVYCRYQTKPDTTFALNIHMPEMASDTFFNGLPGGMFNTFKGISCSGTLAYDLQFFIDTKQPDSLIFESQLKRKNFHIIHNGEENYARINESFVYDACSGDQFIRHIMVGPENPEFTSYGRINPLLPQAIWQSEDPSFMVHRGFVPESFRQSIAQNFKEKRFARGGSTITMQLVKNVFLTRNKTISRKAEEALIVYMIENLGLVPKERMMEVYLNVIEWGPNIYGVDEAAKFYFNKRPADLTLQECIFLAAIIPNPRYFKYQFDKQGEIKPYMADFFKIIEGRLVLRGYLSGRDTIGFVPRVRLSGPALQFVVPVDTIVTEENLPEE